MPRDLRRRAVASSRLYKSAARDRCLEKKYCGFLVLTVQ